MARLGAFEYPELGLLESIELGKKIAREFAGEVSRHGLARSLGMAERGGAFAARIGALRMWGIANGRSRLRVTRDGLRAVNPLSPQESEYAKRKLASQVPLFVEMAARMSSGPYDNARLAVLIEEITEQDRTSVAGRLAMLDRVFSEARPYVLQAQKPSRSPGRFPRLSGPPEALSGLAGPADGYEGGDGEIEQLPDGRIAGESRAATHSLGKAGARTDGERENPADRIEIILPDGKLSLPESVSNLDAALTVLWARRQLVAALDTEKGRPTPTPPREFSGK